MLLGMEGFFPSSDWSSNDWHVVRNPQAARALHNPALYDVVHLLLEREGTATSVARDLGLTLNAAYLHLRALQRVQLVRVAREERRDGRAIKHYTAIAPRLFVPFELLSAPDLEAWYLQDMAEQARWLVRGLLSAYRREWGEPSTLGSSHYRDEVGNTLSTFGPSPGTTWSSLDDQRPATLLNGGSLWLTFQEAKALQRELYTLHARYSRPGRGRRAYRMLLGLAPQGEGDPSEAVVTDENPGP